MTNCLFFGDSITYGEYDGILGGWVDVLKRYLHGKYYSENAKKVNAFNLGIGGENTKGLLSRLENEIKVRISPENNLIFLLYGANDLVIKNNQQNISITEYETNMSLAIDIAMMHTKNVFLISILPISPDIDGKIVSSGKLRTNKNVNEYNKVLKRISKLKNIQYIDVHSIISQDTTLYISKDGIHPNEKGYKVISEIIKPILNEYL